MKPKNVHQFSFVAGRVKNSLEAAALLAVEFEMPEDVFIAYARAAYQESQSYLDDADTQDVEREEFKALLEDASEVEKEVDHLLDGPPLLTPDEFKVGQVYTIDHNTGGFGLQVQGRVVITRVREESEYDDAGAIRFRWIAGGFSENEEGRDDSAGRDFFYSYGTLVSDRPVAAKGQIWRSSDGGGTYELTGRHADGDGWNYCVGNNYTGWLRDAYFTGDFASDSYFNSDLASARPLQFLGYANDANFSFGE